LQEQETESDRRFVHTAKVKNMEMDGEQAMTYKDDINDVMSAMRTLIRDKPEDAITMSYEIQE